jgi:hypothetical protein
MLTNDVIMTSRAARQPPQRKKWFWRETWDGENRGKGTVVLWEVDFKVLKFKIFTSTFIWMNFVTWICGHFRKQRQITDLWNPKQNASLIKGTVSRKIWRDEGKGP